MTDREWAEAHLANALFDAHRDDPEFGYRFLADEVRDAGFKVCERTVWRRCSENGWWSAFGKKKTAKRSKAGTLAHDNLVRRQFRADGPNQLWLADSTEHRTAADGDAIEYANFRHRMWQPACVAAGLGTVTKDPETRRERYEGLTFHDLRRANATALVHANVDLKTAQTRLGHSDPRLTLGVYAQATTQADQAAADVVGDRFSRRPRDGRAMEIA